VVSEIEAGSEIRGGQAIGVDWATRVVQEIVAVLAWVTAGVSGRELELAQAIVEGSVVVGEEVPSKAPAAEAVMCGAPALAAPQVVAVVEAVAVLVLVAAVDVAVVVVGDAGKELF
jgi:hypothetical protein